MVLQKRLDYGFNGYQVPATPRATRSARRRSTSRSRLEDRQLCAFDLLATVAGKLLQEKDTSTASSNTSAEKHPSGFVREECQDKIKPLKPELSDEGSCDRRHSSDLSSQSFDQNCTLKEFSHHENGAHSGPASGLTSSSCSERFADEKLVNDINHTEVENFPCKIGLGATVCGEFSGSKLDGDIGKVKDELHKIVKVPIGTGAELHSFEGPSDEKPPALISSGGNGRFSGYDDNISCSSLSPGCDDVPVVSRDDDEKFSVCTHPSTTTKSFRPMCHNGDRRIRKIIASKYWRAGPQPKVDTLCNNDGNLKPIYPNSKNFYKRQRSQMNIPFKKRKLFDHNSVSSSDRCKRIDGICCSPEKGMKQDTSGSSPRMHRAPGMSSFEARQHTALQSGDSHVKLRIKSFRVPELFIEIPETATIGNLKRTVMEAVTAILGGGLRVGVILQGKKVRDDSRTLLQTGISHDNQLDALGFTLEPNSSQSFPPVYAADSRHVPRADMPHPLTRYPSRPVVNHQRIQVSAHTLPEHQGTSLGNFVESDHDSAPSPPNTSVNKAVTDSNALVPVPEMGVDALSMVPVHQKSKRSEMLQRRVRRPFSVAEVEALVQAVEKLGTGRWRDVKLHAFDNAKHRTYVDLKDKWKTLVHTARISPQQRRGEPVPQELLDRVLTAHAYWYQQQQQQTKQQQLKQPCLLF